MGNAEPFQLVAELAVARPEQSHLQSVLERVAERACELIEGDKSAIIMRDRRDPRMNVCIAGHNTGKSFLSLRPAAEDGIAGKVLVTGRPVVISSYRDLIRPIKHEAARDVHAAVSVPISWNEGVRAALSVASIDPERRFDDADVLALSQLAAFAAVALENSEMRDRLEETLAGGVRSLAQAVELRDGYTGTHSEAVIELALKIATSLGLKGKSVIELGFAARLHDLGKIGIPDEILRKPAPLTEQEWSVMRQHPQWGAQMLADIPGLEAVAVIVRSEHEHWDGSGYPDGISGEDIPFASRIILACDAYHAMTSNRPYRPAIGSAAALTELRTNAGSQFDPDVAGELISLLETRGPPWPATPPPRVRDRRHQLR